MLYIRFLFFRKESPEKHVVHIIQLRFMCYIMKLIIEYFMILKQIK